MTMYTFLFSSRVLEDISQAEQHYDGKQANLSAKFSEEVEEALKLIYENPYFASLRYGGIRCAKIKSFPYLIHYKVVEQRKIVRILAVYNTSRKPLG